MKQRILQLVFFAILAAMVVVIGGCANCPQCSPSPKEDVVIFVGPGIPVIVPKGLHDRPDSMTKEQFDKKLEEMHQQQKKKPAYRI